MATNNRGRSLARHTKVMDSCPGPLKKGRPTHTSPSCDYDVTSLKPTFVGGDVTEATQDTQTIVSKCGKTRCKTCKHIVEGDSFCSNTTGKKYNVISREDAMTCATKNVIYLISCKKCGIQYVGETSQALRNRMNNHRQKLKQMCDLFLYQHFCSNRHNEDDITIMSIEEVFLEDGECLSLASKRLQREEYWYKELATIYPYGLNDNVKNVGNISKKGTENIVVWALFNKRQRKFKKRPHKRKRQHETTRTGIEQKLRNLVNHNQPGLVHKLASLTFSLLQRKLGILIDLANNLLLEQNIPKYIPLIIKDLASFRLGLHKIEESTKTDNTPKSFLKIPFHNKGIEMIKIPQILHSKPVKNTIPSLIQNKTPPTVSYSYTKTIAGKIFNFKQTIKELDFETGTKNLSCNCHQSKFTYQPAGHVVTGNLGIIENRKLRKLLSKGPSYREQNNINWDTNQKILKKAIRDYKLQWAKKEKVDSRVLDEWECKILETIKAKIVKIKTKTKNLRKKHVLSEKTCKNYLEDFQKHFVLVPADKASNNILIVCKKYYLDIVLKELDTSNATSKQTYTPCSTYIENLVAKHQDFMNNQNIKIPEDMKQLPTFYWLPKMHKNPFGSRFIAASSACTTKPLSQLLTSSLKLITKHFKEYCEGIARNTGANSFWIIDNAAEVLQKLKKLNRTKRAKHFNSFDFSTLYTNIPHDLLLNSIGELVREAYRLRGAKYLVIKNNGTAYWSNTTSAKDHSITENGLLEQIKFLVDNIYIQVGNKIFKQTIGIPMGTDCAPLLANLFLFYYEYKFIKEKLKQNNQLAKTFSHTFRYIDDLLTINNPKFEEEIKNIYPPQLELKKTTETNSRLSYLDLELNIVDGRFTTAVFDKRDGFNFHIVNFPHMDSNIPSKPAYGIYISQLVRIGRICDNYKSFSSRHHLLTCRLVKQGFLYDKLCTTFKRFCSRYPKIFSKFGVSIRKHVEDGICLPTVAINRLSTGVSIR